ncbi:MAG: hypothetical protein CUN54_10880, partial [Phototrophicales bacterium]
MKFPSSGGAQHKEQILHILFDDQLQGDCARVAAKSRISNAAPLPLPSVLPIKPRQLLNDNINSGPCTSALVRLMEFERKIKSFYMRMLFDLFTTEKMEALDVY